jgi:hypothetical protein
LSSQPDQLHTFDCFLDRRLFLVNAADDDVATAQPRSRASWLHELPHGCLLICHDETIVQISVEMHAQEPSIVPGEERCSFEVPRASLGFGNPLWGPELVLQVTPGTWWLAVNLVEAPAPGIQFRVWPSGT